MTPIGPESGKDRPTTTSGSALGSVLRLKVNVQLQPEIMILLSHNSATLA